MGRSGVIEEIGNIGWQAIEQTVEKKQ